MLSVIYFLKGQRRPNWEAEGGGRRGGGGRGGQPSPMNEENKKGNQSKPKSLKCQTRFKARLGPLQVIIMISNQLNVFFHKFIAGHLCKKIL
jgi:hypothetical protein